MNEKICWDPNEIFEKFRYKRVPTKRGGGRGEEIKDKLSNFRYRESKRPRRLLYQDENTKQCVALQEKRKKDEKMASKIRGIKYRNKPWNKYNIYRRSAKKRGLLFNLTFYTCNNLFHAPCHYCNIPPIKNILNGIDRVDNNKNYDDDNVVSCCSTCNYMKYIYDYDMFLSKCKVITKNHKYYTEII